MINCMGMEERKHIDDSVLEKMSLDELSDLLVKVSSHLKSRIKNDESFSSGKDETPNKGLWKVRDDMKLMEIDDAPETVNVWEVKILDKMDTSGRPIKEMMKVGAKISQKNMKKMEAIRKDWFEAGGDIEGFLEETKLDRDSQWNRVLSVNGISPTITKTEPQIILVCNEVLTNTDPEEIEVELEVSDPKDSPEPLW